MTEPPQDRAGISVEDVIGAEHNWYHVVELEPGVTTPGWFDLRPHVHVPRIPDDLSGRFALDVGMFDGFWGLEMERRGARVVGIDVDDIPTADVPRIHRDRFADGAAGTTQGTGFRLLKEFLGSSMERVSCDVYDLTPDRIGGRPDVVFIGALLQHLRDPVRALEAVKDTMAEDGLLVLLESVDNTFPRRFKRRPYARFNAHEGWTWWVPSRRCLELWLTTAGFGTVEFVGSTTVVNRPGHRISMTGVHARN